MSAPKRGLGRGLGVLLGESAEPAPPAGLQQIRVEAIRPNPQQPRTAFDPGTLAELEQSIRQLGVLVPILVRPVPGGGREFELIAGERRWRAAAAARLETIPAIVRDADDRASLEVAVVENMQRQDLDALEEAMGYAHLSEKYGFTQERLAERIGKSRPAIANALRLLALSDAIKARLRAGQFTASHARALLALDPARREEIAARIEREHLTVRDIERLGARRKPSAGGAVAATKSADLLAVEGRLRYRFGAPVSIVAAGAGGRIEIRYGDTADLARIVDVLLPEGV